MSAASEELGLETIYRTHSQAEAGVLFARLRAEGIPATLADVQTNNQLPITVGGVRLQVPSRHAGEARALLRDVQSGALAIADEEDAAPPEPVAESAEKPLLWNPDFAALLSWFVFSAVFGALIHAANWKRLGDSDRSVASIVWALGVVVAFMAAGLLAAGHKGALGPYAVIAHVATGLAWYFASGRAQSRYVVEKLKGRYARRGWFNVICVSIIAWGFLLGMTK